MRWSVSIDFRRVGLIITSKFYMIWGVIINRHFEFRRVVGLSIITYIDLLHHDITILHAIQCYLTLCLIPNIP